jgi:hypothetical protein
MSKHGRDMELLRQNDNDLMVQYEELLCLRAGLARLLFPLKISPPRKCRITRRNRSAARAVWRNEWPSSSPPILLLMPERPPTWTAVLARRPRWLANSAGWINKRPIEPCRPALAHRHPMDLQGYLAGYVRRCPATPPISLDRVMKSVWLLEQMGRASWGPRKVTS